MVIKIDDDASPTAQSTNKAAVASYYGAAVNVLSRAVDKLMEYFTWRPSCESIRRKPGC